MKKKRISAFQVNVKISECNSKVLLLRMFSTNEIVTAINTVADISISKWDTIYQLVSKIKTKRPITNMIWALGHQVYLYIFVVVVVAPIFFYYGFN